MSKTEILKSLKMFVPSGDIVEIRAVNGKKTSSGYFQDIKKAADTASTLTGNIYFVFNKIKSGCYSRAQRETMVQNPKETTTDNDIEKRKWILVDVDPKRPSGVSSSDEEKKEAMKVIGSCYSFLKREGFTEPILCDSGNGYHMLYRVELENTKENAEAVKNFLKALDMFCSSDKAEIDTAVFNASRITKLYGTKAMKGSNTPDRPHRESKIIKIPDTLKITQSAKIYKISNMIPKPERLQYPAYQGDFNLRDWISKYSLQVKQESCFSGGTKFILEQCPFDDSHRGKDACIFLMDNGSIGFKCFHNSCSDYTWRDVRLLYEPDAYDRKEYARNTATDDFKPLIEIEPIKDRFLKPSQIRQKDRGQIVTIRSGISMLDRKIIGFNKGELSIWSGSNGSGKSSVLNQLALYAAQQGFRTAIFSGELPSYKVLSWLQLQAAGRAYTRPTEHESLYLVDEPVRRAVTKWLEGKVFIYNNDFGANFESVMAAVKSCISENKIDAVLIDNLMSLCLSGVPGDKYEKQTAIVTELSNFAKNQNVHIHFVCHPRKSLGFLRKDDISGSADLTNAADNVFIVHRVGNDFRKKTAEMFGWKPDNQMYDFSNVIEVCKNRDLGVIDFFAGTYFEVESKSFLNYPEEMKRYDWSKEDLL